MPTTISFFFFTRTVYVIRRKRQGWNHEYYDGPDGIWPYGYDHENVKVFRKKSEAIVIFDKLVEGKEIEPDEGLTVVMSSDNSKFMDSLEESFQKLEKEHYGVRNYDKMKFKG